MECIEFMLANKMTKLLIEDMIRLAKDLMVQECTLQLITSLGFENQLCGLAGHARIRFPHLCLAPSCCWCSDAVPEIRDGPSLARSSRTQACLKQFQNSRRAAQVGWQQKPVGRHRQQDHQQRAETIVPQSLAGSR